MSYSVVNGRVHIELTREEYHLLLMALGAAAASEFGMQESFIRLANSINDGNPSWTPFEVKQ
jgi:hypothetical protein